MILEAFTLNDYITKGNKFEKAKNSEVVLIKLSAW